MGINFATGGQQSHPGFTPITKQTYSFYSTSYVEATLDFTNVPDNCSAVLVTYYTGTEGDHIDWHMGRSVNAAGSWQGGANDPGWSDAWGDVIQTWVGNVGGYSWWFGSSVIPVDSQGKFKVSNAGVSGLGNRLRLTCIGYFGGDN